MMVKSNVETQTEEKNGMKRAKLDLEGEQLLKAQEQILTTILESTETETMETLERSRNIPIQLDSSQRIDNDLSYSYGERNGFEAQMDFHQEKEDKIRKEKMDLVIKTKIESNEEKKKLCLKVKLYHLQITRFSGLSKSVLSLLQL